MSFVTTRQKGRVRSLFPKGPSPSSLPKSRRKKMSRFCHKAGCSPGSSPTCSSQHDGPDKQRPKSQYCITVLTVDKSRETWLKETQLRRPVPGATEVLTKQKSSKGYSFPAARKKPGAWLNKAQQLCTCSRPPVCNRYGFH